MDNLSEINGRIKVLEENEKVQDKRLDKHGEEIDSLEKSLLQQEATSKLIQKDVENINRTTTKTEDKIDEVIKIRNTDHYEKPLGRYSKIIETIVIAVVGAIIGMVLVKIGLK